MAFRNISVTLTADTAPYTEKLRAAGVETRAFGATGAAAGVEVQAGMDTAAKGAATYSAAITETAAAETRAASLAEANVAKKVASNAALVEQAKAYKAISLAAEEGSAKQIAADRLLEVANKKLVASNLEVVESTSLMSGAGAKLGNVFEQLGLRVERSHGLVGAATKGITTDSSTMATGVGAALGVTAAAFGVLAIEGVKHFQELTGEVRSFQRIAGTSAEDSSRLIYAFKELGIAPDVAAKSIGLFSRNLVDHADKVEAAGVSIAHLKNGNVDTIGSLFNLADAFQKVGPGAEGTTLALDLMGRGGAALIPVLQRGRDGLKEFFAEAKAHGVVFSDEDITKGKELTLATKNLHEAFTGFEISLAKDVIPQLTGVAHGLASITDAVSAVHLPVVPMLEVGAAALAATKGVAAFGAGVTALGAEAAGAAIAGMAGLAGGVTLAAGAFVLLASTVDKNVGPAKALDDSFINAERHIPLVGNALANLDQHLPGVTHNTQKHSTATAEQVVALAGAKTALANFNEELDTEELSSGKLTESHKQMVAETKKFDAQMASTASSIGISVSALSGAIGQEGRVGVASFDEQTAAAKRFAQEVSSGMSSASSSFAKGVDSVSAFSASSLASSDKAADKVVANDTRVADSIQRVADLQEQFAEKATKDREAYADKVKAADQALTDADAKYADTVETGNQRVADSSQKLADDRTAADEKIAAADQTLADTQIAAAQKVDDAERKIADDRISIAENVAAAERRLTDDMESGHDSVAKAQQRLVDTQQRQAVQNDPKASKALNDSIALRDAQNNVADAQEAARKKEQADREAIVKAQQAGIKTLEKDEDALAKAKFDGIKSVEKAQDAADKARQEAVRVVIKDEKELQKVRQESAKAAEQAEDALAKARQNSAKLAAEANTVGTETTQQQREMQKAIEAVTKAQDAQTSSITGGASKATETIKLTVGQVADFYKNAIGDSQKFSDDIHGAIEKGYNPLFIARLMEEGPKEAKPVLELIASQTDNTFRDMVNNGEEKLNQMKLHNADINRAVELAAHDSGGRLRADFETEMKALAILGTEGGRDTAEGLAKKLGVGVEEVRRIAAEYGGALADGINPVLAGIGANNLAVGGFHRPGLAEGGKVPGHGDGDTVPAMLTPGEFVISKPAVQRIGVHNLESMHQTARRGYASGGFVTAADVPKPPDYHAYGNMVGYSADMGDKKASDLAVSFVNAHSKHGGGGGGGGYGFQALIDYLNGKGVPNEVTSTTGGTHAANSRHGMGLAADFVSDYMAQIAAAFTDIRGSMYELIHNPGFSIKDGKDVGADFWGSETWANHANHVHAATYKDASEGPGIPGSGVEGSGGPPASKPSGQVADWVAAGVSLAGRPDDWVQPEVNIAMFESGGDPNAINEWDSNATAGTPSKGLMQVIDPTFQSYKVAGHDDIWNPIDNVAAASNYIQSRYGSPFNTPGEKSVAHGGAYQGYEVGGLVVHNAGIMDQGAMVPPGAFLGMNNTGNYENLRPMPVGPASVAAAPIDYDRLGVAVAAALVAQPLRATVSAQAVSDGMYALRNGRSR